MTREPAHLHGGISAARRRNDELVRVGRRPHCSAREESDTEPRTLAAAAADAGGGSGWSSREPSATLLGNIREAELVRGLHEPHGLGARGSGSTRTTSPPSSFGVALMLRRVCGACARSDVTRARDRLRVFCLSMYMLTFIDKLFHAGLRPGRDSHISLPHWPRARRPRSARRTTRSSSSTTTRVNADGPIEVG